MIDGIITTNLNSISPADIETMQILKDASASAIYGADGANGGVIITTKRGEPGKTRVYYENYFSSTRMPRKLELMNADQYADFYNAMNEKAGIFQPAYSDEFRQWYYGEGWHKGTDWQDEITRNGFGQNHYLRLSGGSETSTYSISGNFYDETGILLNTGARKYNLRANSDYKIGKRVRVGETITLTRLRSRIAENVFSSTNIVSPLMRVHNPDNKEGFEGPQIPFEYTVIRDSIEYNIINNTGGNDKTNPVAEEVIPQNYGYNNVFLGNLYMEIEPVKGLVYRLSGSVTTDNYKSKTWTPAYDLGVRSKAQASLEERYSENILLQLQNQVTYHREFNDHSLTVTAVHQVQSSDGDYINGSANGFPYENLNVFTQALEGGKILSGGYDAPFRMISYLGRVMYAYKNKILFTGSFRSDGVSRFKMGNRWGNFPAASVAWKLNEDLLRNVEKINMLKIRLGWGKTGNSDIGDFLYEDFLSNPLYFSNVFGDPNTLVPGTNVFYSFANALIRWEAASMTNLGLDVSAFGNKLQASIEYYWKLQNDLLVKVPVSKIFGRSGEGSDPWDNAGEVLNTGLETNISYKNFDRKFKYSATFGLTTFHNEVKYLPKTEIISGNTRTIEGRTIGSLYGYVAERIITPDDFTDYNEETGIYSGSLYAVPSEGVPQPGDLKFKDLNQDGAITDIDRAIIGKSLPDLISSLSLTFEYGSFDFSMMLNGMFRYQVFNAQRANLSSFVSQDINHNKLAEWAQNAYTVENPSDKYVRADMRDANLNDRISTWWIEDASFVRIRNIQLGYSFPHRLISRAGISRLRLYGSATNPILFTGYSGRDPENAAFSSPLSSGTDDGGIPNPRVLTLGMQIEF